MLLQKKTTPLIVDFFFGSGKIDIMMYFSNWLRKSYY